jgi:hypothetical protein
MDYEQFKANVKATFPTHTFTAQAFEEICQEVYRDTEKAVEANGDESLKHWGWWEIAMETLPEYFVNLNGE